MPLIWLKNLFSTVVSIMLPSLIIPFSGAFLGLGQGFAFGVGFAPVNSVTAKFISSLVLIILEGQAAVLGIAGSLAMGRSLFRPTTLEAQTSRKKAYLFGLVEFTHFLFRAAGVLLVAALNETASMYFKF